MPLTIALCQIKVSDCVNESLKSFYNIFSGLARQGVDVAVLPEGWTTIDPLSQRSDPAGDEGLVVERLSGLAEELGLWILGGALYVRRGEDTFVSCPVIDDGGRVVAWQDKIHLYQSESKIFKPGTRLEPIRVKDTMCGILICHDIAYPEAARSLVLRGAEVIFNPSKIVARGVEAWHLYIKVRSLENRVPVYGVNVWCEPRFRGGSIAVKPVDWGENIFMPQTTVADPGESVLIDVLEPSSFSGPRGERLSKRMPEAYSGLLSSRNRSAGGGAA